MCQESRVVWDVKISRETVIQQKLESYLSGPKDHIFFMVFQNCKLNTSEAPARFTAKLLRSKCKLVESRNIDIRDSVNYKEVMKHFGLGPNGAIMILGLPVLCFLFFGSPVRWKMVLCRLVLCRLCGLDSMLIHQNLERLAMKFQNNNGNPNDHVS